MMRLGVNVPNFGPEANPGTLLAWARFAETNGFATLTVSDHVAPTPEVSDIYPSPFYDPFVLLAWLAGQTTTLRLATSVLVVPYRHPLLTARMSAVAHDLSGGRFVLGAGIGWARTEFEALGLDAASRGRTTDAYLEVITNAWAQERVSSDLPGLTFDDVATGPARIGGRVPLWVGGAGAAAIKRAVRFGDAWHPINPELTQLRDVGLPALGHSAAAAGRAVPQLVPRIKTRLSVEPGPVGRPLGVGTLGQVVDDLAALADLGAVEVILDPNPDRLEPRDFDTERRQLLEVKQAWEQRSAARPALST
jgi:probable F420-dependent oxidoreductase